MFFKKDKIKFYCELPEIKEKYPIIDARQYKFDWFKKSAQSFKEVTQAKAAYEQISGIVKCPGIRPVMQQGYIVQSWFDLTIKVYDDGFEYFVPQGFYSYLEDRQYKKNLVTPFLHTDKAHALPVSDNQMQSLIKISLPWAVKVPASWELLFMPLPYPDNTQFTAVHGMLGKGDFYNLNAILKLNVNPGEEFTIYAGTPLFQLIPTKNTNIDIEIKDYTDDIKEKERKVDYLVNHCFITKNT